MSCMHCAHLVYKASDDTYEAGEPFKSGRVYCQINRYRNGKAKMYCSYNTERGFAEVVWFEVPVKFCPWCGNNLIGEKR